MVRGPSESGGDLEGIGEKRGSGLRSPRRWAGLESVLRPELKGWEGDWREGGEDGGQVGRESTIEGDLEQS